MSTFWQHLGEPEYLHTLINPLPVCGLGVGVLGLCFGIYFRARVARLAGLFLIMVSAALVWPVCYYFGWHDVQTVWDQNQNAWSSREIRPGEAFVSLFFVVAALSALTIIMELKAPPVAVPLAMATLLPGIAAVVLGVYMIFTDCPIVPRDSQSLSLAPTVTTDHQEGSQY